MIGRMCFLGLVGVILLARLPTAQGVLAALAGALSGTSLAWHSLKHTRIEVTDLGKFYTPNKWIGLGLTALLLGRMAARMVTVFEVRATANAHGTPDSLPRSPFTLGIFTLLASYYITYYAAILRRSRDTASVTPPAS